MNGNEILSIVITIVGLLCFIALFTYLYKNYANSSIADIKDGKRDIELVNIVKDEENIKKKKKRNNIIKSSLFYLFLALIIPVFIFSIINKVNGSVTMIAGKGMMVVASGSMSYKNEDNAFINDKNVMENYNVDNQFKKFDMIIIEKVKSKEQIRLYDVIAFRTSKGNVIHRVVNIQENNGITTYVTQGDALSVEDGLRPTYEDVIGIYKSKRIPVIGALILFAQSSAGIITIISLIYCLTMLDRTNGKIEQEEQKRIEELKKVLDYKNDGEEIKTEYYEEIIYKGYAYRFTSDGFKDKRKVIEREKKDD